ncbi:TldD/PmbA family protein [Aureimonas sp. AU40]|uniref:TldD/PmbA family protein n=1 Tax=Aureimonas sp. AU40 TaxID=1637747 RepID=UPI00078517AB|nr:TldD/PmbA family protein [Aureimonas sp. AU40]
MNDDIPRLLDLGARLVEAARRSGADAADAAVVSARSRSVQVRMGRVEELESSESDEVSLRVFVGRRVATVSSDLRSDPQRLAERAVAMARVSPEDPYAGLADASLLSDGADGLDLYDPTEPDGAALADEAKALEAAALAVQGVSNSSGATSGFGTSGLVLVTSTGFSGSRLRSGFSRSVSVVAGEGTGMERDYDFDSRIHAGDLDAAEAIGRRAGERAVRRLHPAKMDTGRYAIVLDPRVSRGFIGSLVGALNGASIARRTSFLKDRMGERVLPEGLDLVDDPQLARRPGSRPFDGEGVRGERLMLVENGTLRNWVLDSATARELNLASNGRASRSSSGVSPSSSNVTLTPGARSAAELIRDTGRGIYVTETIGHGANLVTGDYSCGASGFLIENGELAGPVSEFTIAGNLTDMFAAIEPANDGDTRFSLVVPSLRIGEMTVAGR